MEEKNISNESAEELEAEKEHLAEVKEDEIRQEVIDTYGFSEDDDEDRIAKAVEREVKHRKSLSSAIGQKRKYRDEYNRLKTTPPKTDDSGSKDNDENLDKRLTVALEKRDLEQMEYSDEIKKQIEQVAKINNISIRKAVSDPYIASKIKEWQKVKGTDEAAISRNNRSGGKASTNSDPLIPPDVDFDTEEGRKEYDDWKAKMIKEGH